VDFSYSPEQESIRRSIQDLVKDFPDEYWLARDRAHEFPWDFYNVIAKAGYLGMVIPEEYGGSGLGITEAGIVLMEIAASGAAINGASAIHLSMFGINPVVKHGSDEMRRKYLPQVIAGDLHVCFGVTEPDAGTDTTRITTNAVRDGDDYIINGKKVWLTKAADCQKVLLLTRTTPLNQCRKRTDGMTLFFADLDPSAVTIRPIEKMGRNAVASKRCSSTTCAFPRQMWSARLDAAFITSSTA
jgi:acyl-CoA dehydrogenase